MVLHKSAWGSYAAARPSSCVPRVSLCPLSCSARARASAAGTRLLRPCLQATTHLQSRAVWGALRASIIELDWNPAPVGGPAYWIDLILLLRGFFIFLWGGGVGGAAFCPGANPTLAYFCFSIIWAASDAALAAEGLFLFHFVLPFFFSPLLLFSRPGLFRFYCCFPTQSSAWSKVWADQSAATVTRARCAPRAHQTLLAGSSSVYLITSVASLTQKASAVGVALRLCPSLSLSECFVCFSGFNAVLPLNGCQWESDGTNGLTARWRQCLCPLFALFWTF